MTESLIIALGIFVVLYIAYLILSNRLKKYKLYTILVNCLSIVLCLVLIIDALNRGSSAFIFILLLMLAISVKKLIDESKKRGII